MGSGSQHTGKQMEESDNQWLGKGLEVNVGGGGGSEKN